MTKATEILKELEKHCDEKLQCSGRLRFQIESTMQRIIDEHEGLKVRMSRVIDGESTFDPKKYETRMRRG